MSACEVKNYKAERLMTKKKERDENVKLVLDSSMKLENSWSKGTLSSVMMSVSSGRLA